MNETSNNLIARLSDPGALSVRDAARVMSLVEQDVQAATDVLQQFPTADGQIIGITGPPGAGKSLLIDAMLTKLRARDENRKIGVIAVDPSSPRSGGALLGDRVRMMRHAGDKDIFIRSIATRGHMGGLANGVAAIARVMQLIGADLVLIETVGVGQNETEIVSVADRVAIVLAPGTGDSMQWMKSGLMEIGDCVVANKSDQPGIEQLQQQLLATLNMQHRDTPVVAVSAMTGDGIESLLDTLLTQS